MKWVFATIAVLVTGGVAAYGIYTFSPDDTTTRVERADAASATLDREQGASTATPEEPDVAEVRAVWADYNSWKCPAFAKHEREFGGYEADTRSCVNSKIVSIDFIRRGLWRIRVQPGDDSAGSNYRPSCYVIEPKAYEPPPLTATWPDYESPGVRMLSFDVCPP